SAPQREERWRLASIACASSWQTSGVTVRYCITSLSAILPVTLPGNGPSSGGAPMQRREFLEVGSSLALSAAGYFAGGADAKPKRVGLIGCGWYGKCDLFRLIQVEPVEVISLCDVDKKMLAEAADMVAVRQASKKKPRTYADYRELLKEKDLDIV